MTPTIQDVQALLRRLAADDALAPFDRISAALRGASEGRGVADAVVLLRQVLRADDVRRGSGGRTLSPGPTSAWLDVPKALGFAEKVPWDQFGMEASDRGDADLRVRANPWKPKWLNLGSAPAVDHDVSSLSVVRRDETVRGDPFLELLGREFEEYRTPGQRTAVRSALLAGPGSTLVVNLPTGGGKTLAMLAPAVLRPPDGSVSLVVVPTVALALDQARRYAAQHSGSPPTAYHGGLTRDQKADFFRRISSGAQPIVFTNPEAVVTSLARPLTEAAAGGRIRLVAVDEAHVVGSWGDGFRPHFHALAGFRTHLLREAHGAGQTPFRTVLASATLTEDTLNLLEALFGVPGPFIHVGAPVVRVEPTFWAAHESDAREREDRIVESLRHLPRPAIVYTTLRDESAARPDTLTPGRLRRMAVSSGFSRFAVVDGNSTTDERERILRSLRDSEEGPSSVDLVFATSAFGLGIDVPDIRTIVHACVPENLDRYYQEVGRGGRDGRPSISLVVPTKGDWEVASGLATPRLISSGRARERWNAMIQGAEPFGGGSVRVPLAAVPAGLEQHSDYNERWNFFTVSLMARAGALAWDFSLAEIPSDSDRTRDDRGWLTVRVLRGDHQSDWFWNNVVEPFRVTMVDRARHGLAALKTALSGHSCTGMLMAQNYSIARSGFETTCLPSCGGCVQCRAAGRERWSSPSPRPGGVELPPEPNPPRLYRLASAGKWGPRLIVGLRPQDIRSPRRMRRVVRSLISAGNIRLLVVPRARVLSAWDWLPPPDSERAPVMLMELEEFDPVSEVGVPTLGVVLDGADPTMLLDGSSRSSLFLILAPEDLRVEESNRPLMELDAAYHLEDLEQAL